MIEENSRENPEYSKIFTNNYFFTLFFGEGHERLLIPILSLLPKYVWNCPARLKFDCKSGYRQGSRIPLHRENQWHHETLVIDGKTDLPKMDPPIHVEYNRSWGAEIRIFVSFGDGFLNSDSKRSPNPETLDDIEFRVTFTVQSGVIWGGVGSNTFE